MKCQRRFVEHVRCRALRRTFSVMSNRRRSDAVRSRQHPRPLQPDNAIHEAPLYRYHALAEDT